jgi:hypothetical protein
MKVTYNKKQTTMVCNAAIGSLVMVKIGESKTPTLCLIVSSSSMKDIVDDFFNDGRDFYDLNRTAVVEVESGKIYLLPDYSPCEIVDKYNFTVESL